MQSAELTSLDASLLAPALLPGLWPSKDSSVPVGQVLDFFDGHHVTKLPREGYEEALAVPRADAEVVKAAIGEAVKSGGLWLVAGPASIFKEPIPLGVLTTDALLNPPPAEIPATSVLPQNLPEVWQQGITTVAAVSAGLSAKNGKLLPWTLTASTIDSAIRGRLLEVCPDGAPWPCAWSAAGNVRLRVPQAVPPTPPVPVSPPRDTLCTESELEPSELQDFIDGLGEILKTAAGLDLRFSLRLEVGKGQELTTDQLAKLNEVLAKACGKLKFDR